MALAEYAPLVRTQEVIAEDDAQPHLFVVPYPEIPASAPNDIGSITLDTFKVYWGSVRRQGLLSEAEQANLLELVEDARIQGLVEAIPAKEEPDNWATVGEIARCEVIARNLRLPLSIAIRRMRSGIPLLDIVQTGNVALIKAVDRFDTSEKVKLGTYATIAIKRDIQAFILTEETRTSVDAAYEIDNLKRIIPELTQQLKREPAMAEIAEFSELSRDKVEKMILAFQPPESLDGISDSGDMTVADFIDTQKVGKDKAEWSHRDQIEQADLAIDLCTALQGLRPKEKVVLEMRFGILTGQPYDQKEIAEEMNISKSRVSAIERKALAKLRTNYPEFLEYFSAL